MRFNKMDLVQKSMQLLELEKDYTTSIKYSGQFKGYNANIRMFRDRIEVRLSKNWRGVDQDIQIGLIQSLLLKLFNKRQKTTNIDLYNIFMQRVHTAVPKTINDPILEESFNRVNDQYFLGMMEQPNLMFGNENIAKLGSYDYGADLITISSVLKEQQHLLDYVMYHELLHKKLKFKHNSSRNYHHTKEFKEMERRFEDPDVENKLKKFLRRKRFFKLF